MVDTILSADNDTYSQAKLISLMAWW